MTSLKLVTVATTTSGSKTQHIFQPETDVPSMSPRGLTISRNVGGVKERCEP